MAPVWAQLYLWFVSYTQNTEGCSGQWRWYFFQIVKFISHLSGLLWTWSFVTNTCYMSSFICRWFRVNPIPGLRDIIELLELARNRAEQSIAEAHWFSRIAIWFSRIDTRFSRIECWFSRISHEQYHFRILLKNDFRKLILTPNWVVPTSIWSQKLEYWYPHDI